MVGLLVACNMASAETLRPAAIDRPGNGSLRADEWRALQAARQEFLARSCRILAGRHGPLGAFLATKEFTRRLQHLLVDDEHRAIYCYVPKVACTNWKRIWMILTNKTSAESPDAIPSHVPHTTNVLRSLADSSYTADDVRTRLSTYTKFLFVRHPMERLVSAFRNKFEKSSQFSKSIGPEILRKFRKSSGESSLNSNVTFSEFVSYVVDRKFRRREVLNEHWEAYTDLCLPCIVSYDYVGKYDTLKEDSDRILEEIGAPDGLRFPAFVRSATASLVPRYLSTLPPSELRFATDVYKMDFLLFQYQFPIFRNLTST
ncbi:hypothetical protein HAZT_HAZT005227 [Hyalella azteca]|uniref:Carbohydrate sulfotransferase n=1 Tax=Hyalella azteca TaxID=294128 RepID=A0A6A0GQY6_HYAAZ|nr:hypothetical protein HAZT_HAZT005227 [Hyalella azteca]